MSKIQDLIDLKLMHPNAEEIYDNQSDFYDHKLLTEGIMVVLRNNEDTDPELSQGYYKSPGISVTIAYGSGLYKSHEVSGSYGRTEWTEWKEVKAVPKIAYHYAESAY